MLDELKTTVLQASELLLTHGSAAVTGATISCIDRKSGRLLLKSTQSQGFATIDIKTGNILESDIILPLDAQTHRVIYQAFREVGGAVSCHSHFATVFSQAGRGIPPMGTMHATFFFGAIPCTRPLIPQEIREDHAYETGLVIAETFKQNGIEALDVPAVLVQNQGPFVWGETPLIAASNAVALEEAAKLAYHTYQLCGTFREEMSSELLKRRFLDSHKV